MKTPTALLKPRPPRPHAQPLQPRAPQATWWQTASPLRPATAAHDFLVPNPRPDLTTDVRTLRMIEAG